MTPRATYLGKAAATGARAGVVAATAMLVTEKAEQAVTQRPDSYVPGRALRTILGRPAPDAGEPAISGLVMHYASGAALGALRGVWAGTGLRGPGASAAHLVARLMTDQTIENAAGVGAPPQTWPTQERTIDIFHKAVYAAVTGALADRWIAPTLESDRGAFSH